MTERPILFSAEMVRAILAGRKTQTRRKAPIRELKILQHPGDMLTWSVSFLKAIKGTLTSHSGGKFSDLQARSIIASQFNPYGKPGDLLWVREGFAVQPELWADNRGPQPIHYTADSVIGFAGKPDLRQIEDYRSKPSIHMPRWASRITLEVKSVRVERLQDISEDDARAEGATMRPSCNGFQHRHSGWRMDWSEVGKPSYFATGAQRGKKAPLTESDVSLGSAKWAFASFWTNIHGPGAWDENPWVWVLSFERVKP